MMTVLSRGREGNRRRLVSLVAALLLVVTGGSVALVVGGGSTANHPGKASKPVNERRVSTANHPGKASKPVNKRRVELLESSTASPATWPKSGLGAGNEGWALTTEGLQVSHNGGGTFTVVRPPISVNEIGDVVLSGTEMTVVGADQKASDGEVLVTRSSNGGRTWSAVTQLALPPSSLPSAEQLVTTNGGSIAGMLVTTISPPSSWATWYSTTNNGMTWTEYGAPSGGVVSDAGGTLWLVSNATSRRLFSSSDDGQHWAAVSLPSSVTGDALDVAGALSTGRVVLVADAPNPTTGSPSVDILTTSDAGTTWQPLAHTSFGGVVGRNVPVYASVAGRVQPVIATAAL